MVLQAVAWILPWVLQAVGFQCTVSPECKQCVLGSYGLVEIFSIHFQLAAAVVFAAQLPEPGWHQQKAELGWAVLLPSTNISPQNYFQTSFYIVDSSNDCWQQRRDQQQ